MQEFTIFTHIGMQHSIYICIAGHIRNNIPAILFYHSAESVPVINVSVFSGKVGTSGVETLNNNAERSEYNTKTIYCRYLIYVIHVTAV